MRAIPHNAPQPPDSNDPEKWARWELEWREHRFWQITDWHNLRSRVSGSADLSPAESADVLQAVDVLREEFGDGHLRRLVRAGLNVEFLINLAPWPLRILAEDASNVRVVKGQPGYEFLRARIRSGTKTTEAWTVLDVGASLVRAGARVEFDPQLASCKVPDLAVHRPGGAATEYVEVSRLGPSVSHQLVDATTELANRLMFENDVLAAGEFHGPLQSGELAEVEALLGAIMKRIRENQSIEEHDLGGRAEIVVGASDHFEEVAQWAARRGAAAGIGTRVPDEDWPRLRSKLKREQEQLPANGQGAVVISCTGSALVWPDWQGLAANLEAELERYPHVAAVIVKQVQLDPGAAGDAIHEIGGQVLLERLRGGIVRERRLLVVPPRAREHWLPAALRRGLAAPFS